jgi:hypothetical protein
VADELNGLVQRKPQARLADARLGAKGEGRGRGALEGVGASGGGDTGAHEPGGLLNVGL